MRDCPNCGAVMSGRECRNCGAMSSPTNKIIVHVIQVGDRVRSYDFPWRCDKCYVEGVVVELGRFPKFPDCDRYKISVDRRMWDGKLEVFDGESFVYPTQKPLKLLERIIEVSSNPNDVVLDAFCGCGTAVVAAESLGRQWIGIDISPTACRVMAKRLQEVCHLPENEKLRQIGRGFALRDLPWSEEQLRKIPPFEFENWAVIAIGGLPNKKHGADGGIDGRIFPA